MNLSMKTARAEFKSMTNEVHLELRMKWTPVEKGITIGTIRNPV